MPVVKRLLKEDFQLVYLIKPQFEAGREQVKKNGVVRDPKVHISVMKNILSFSHELGLFPEYVTYSPITGPKGNIEFLAYCKKSETLTLEEIDSISEEIVKKAYDDLKS